MLIKSNEFKVRVERLVNSKRSLISGFIRMSYVKLKGSDNYLSIQLRNITHPFESYKLLSAQATAIQIIRERNRVVLDRVSYEELVNQYNTGPEVANTDGWTRVVLDETVFDYSVLQPYISIELNRTQDEIDDIENKYLTGYYGKN